MINLRGEFMQNVSRIAQIAQIAQVAFGDLRKLHRLSVFNDVDVLSFE